MVKKEAELFRSHLAHSCVKVNNAVICGTNVLIMRVRTEEFSELLRCGFYFMYEINEEQPHEISLFYIS